MCRDPVTRTPARGFSPAYLLRIAIRPGISCSAMVISLRPQSARPRSATLYGRAAISSVVAISFLLLISTYRDILMCTRTALMPSIVKTLRAAADPPRPRILLLQKPKELSVAELQEILV